MLTSTESNPLTLALAESGRPVVRSPEPEIQQCLAALGGNDWHTVPAIESHAHISEFEHPSESDRALVTEVAHVLARVGQPVVRIGLARAIGANPGNLVLSKDAGQVVASARELIRASRRWNSESTLLLDARQPALGAARKHASKSLREVAHVLARLILLDRDGVADMRSNVALLEDYALEGR